MKNIIKSSICLLTIICILLCSSVPVKAAESDVEILASSTANANTIYSETGSSEYNSQSVVTMQYSTNIKAQIKLTDGYFTGYYRFKIKYTPQSLGNYWQLQAANVSAQLVSDSNDEYRTTIYQYPSSAEVGVEVYFYNFPCFNDYIVIDLGVFTWIYSWYNTNSTVWASIPASTPLTKVYTYQTSYKAFTAIPNTTQNYTLIWKQVILDALAAQDLDDVYTLLNQWKTTQDQWLADIYLNTEDVEDILLAIGTTLSNMYNQDYSTQQKIYQIYNLLSGFPSYSYSVLNKLDTIINQNASDTAAESQMQNAEQQLSQAVNDMEVQKPNINNVVNAGDQYLSQDITNSQSDTFFWLHGSNILVTILTMAITVGIIGFVIYGKSG